MQRELGYMEFIQWVMAGRKGKGKPGKRERGKRKGGRKEAEAAASEEQTRERKEEKWCKISLSWWEGGDWEWVEVFF